jgi:hypothetical protein
MRRDSWARYLFTSLEVESGKSNCSRVQRSSPSCFVVWTVSAPSCAKSIGASGTSGFLDHVRSYAVRCRAKEVKPHDPFRKFQYPIRPTLGRPIPVLHPRNGDERYEGVDAV